MNHEVEAVETVTMQDAVEAMERARAIALAVQETEPTRELAVAVTYLDTALLWVVQDDRMRSAARAAGKDTDYGEGDKSDG